MFLLGVETSIILLLGSNIFTCFCKDSGFIDKIIKSIIEQSGPGVTEKENREDI